VVRVGCAGFASRLGRLGGNGITSGQVPNHMAVSVDHGSENRSQRQLTWLNELRGVCGSPDGKEWKE
jgi:hypothetical protein